MEDAELDRRIREAERRAFARTGTEADRHELAELLEQRPARRPPEAMSDHAPAGSPSEWDREAGDARAGDADPAESDATQTDSHPADPTPRPGGLRRRALGLVAAGAGGALVGALAVGLAPSFTPVVTEAPDMSATVELRLTALYEYYVTTLTPCLEGRGHEVSEPPPLDEFLDQFETDPWVPFAEAADETAGDPEAWFLLESSCPQTPPSWAVEGGTPALQTLTEPGPVSGTPPAALLDADIETFGPRRLSVSGATEVWATLAARTADDGSRSLVTCLAVEEADSGELFCTPVWTFLVEGITARLTHPGGGDYLVRWAANGSLSFADVAPEDPGADD